MRRSCLVFAALVALAAPARPGGAQAPSPAAAPSARPAARGVTRISYWTVRPGKDTEARAFWKPVADVFEEMKGKGLVVDYQFLEPAIHTGQDWQLAYIWVCRDMAAYGAADQYFSDAVAHMDSAKVSQDFNAIFDGSKHRDELWRTVEMR